MSRDYDNKIIGDVICKGSGLKVYFSLPLTKKLKDGTEHKKNFYYNIGNLQQILTETNRQESVSYIAGRRYGVDVNKGIRTSYGTITFTQLDSGMINLMLNDIKSWNKELQELEDADLDGFSFESLTMAEESAPVFSGAKDSITVNIYDKEIVDLQDLPPIDIIVVASGGNQIDENGNFEANKQYQFVCKKTVFMSETFGISAGTPLHNVATKCLFLGDIISWKEVESNE